MAWQLLFTFPNLVLPTPSPFDGGDIYLCGGEDARLAGLASNPGNRTGRRMLTQFSGSFGDDYVPSCLLVLEGANAAITHADALGAFRNICAVAATSRAWAQSLTRPAAAQFSVRWSDNFSFGFHTPGHSGAIINLNGPIHGTDHRIQRFSGHAAAHIGSPTNYHVDVDRQLFTRLLTAWRRYYVHRRERRIFRPLFRSLEVAFHAGLFPGDGLTTINDAGTRLGLWVSAFEILFHPPGLQNVNKRVVQLRLRNTPFRSREARATRFAVRYGGVTHRAVLTEAIYDDLYDARNAFFHGNPVTGRRLRYRHSRDHVQLIAVAPVLYNAALLAFLNGVVPDGPEAAIFSVEGLARYMQLTEDASKIEEALNAVRYTLDEHGHPQVPRWPRR